MDLNSIWLTNSPAIDYRKITNHPQISDRELINSLYWSKQILIISI